MRVRVSVLTALTVMSVALLGCEPDPESSYAGGGTVAITVDSSALSASDIDAVEITVSGDGISPDIIAALVESPEDHWSGLVTDIPAGTGRDFAAAAYDEEGSLIYSGTAEDVTIEAGVVQAVTIFLQQTDQPKPFDNSVPFITSFTVSPLTADPGEEVALTVAAVDAEDDSLVYAWSADAGTFSAPSLPSTSWTAPDTEGAFTVSIAVSDSEGATAELEAVIQVLGSAGETGNATIDTVINSAPNILGLVPSPSRIDVGESTQLDLTVSDPEGDPVSVSWSADCGVFDDNRIEDPTFTLTALTGDTCDLTVQVWDDHYLDTYAIITIQTGPPLQTDGVDPVATPLENDDTATLENLAIPQEVRGFDVGHGLE